MKKSSIYVNYGDNPFEMVKELLNFTKPFNGLNKGVTIGIKPNLVLPSPSKEGATTSPELVAGVISYLKSKGFNNVNIMESSWVGANTKEAFKLCGYEELAREYNVKLIDLKDDNIKSVKVNGMELKVCQKAIKTDYLINIPVLKAHCQTKLTCALKNLKGCIPDSEKRRFHTLGLHKPIAYLNRVLKSNLVIVDGIFGDLTFEEGGNPVQMNRIILGKDPLLIDCYAAMLLGYNWQDIGYLTIANNINLGSTELDNVEIKEFNSDNYKQRNIVVSREIKQLIEKIVEEEACSACYGSLIHALMRLREKGYSIKNNIYIGQGFRNKRIHGIGIGNCTNKFLKNVTGCPPTAKEIVDFFLNQ